MYWEKDIPMHIYNIHKIVECQYFRGKFDKKSVLVVTTLIIIVFLHRYTILPIMIFSHPIYFNIVALVTKYCTY